MINSIQFKFTRRVLLSAIALLLLSTLSACSEPSSPDFAGERVVSVLDEPRHRTVHHEGDLYLVDVQINPGDTSLPHTHNQAIMYTSISRGDGPRDGSVSSNTDYVNEALTHKVPNPGPGLFRIIAMVNVGEGNPELEAGRPSGLEIAPQLENPWFRSYKLELAAGEETAVQAHEFPSAIIQIQSGVFHVSRSDGVTAELDNIADWAWRDANANYTVKNVGELASAVVINEGRN